MATKDPLDLIEDEIIKEMKPAHTRKSNGKKIKVRSSVEKAHDDYKGSVAHHNAEIKKLKRQIRSHKLLKAQSRNAYKLVKLASK